MKLSNLLGLCATVAVVAAPITAYAAPASDEGVTIDGGKKEYNEMPSIEVLPAKYVFPVLTNMAKDPSITTDSPIADKYPPPPVPDRVTLDDLPGIRAEYTATLNQWAEEVKECLVSKPNLIRIATGEPILFDGKAGTVVLNANDRPVCP